MKPEKFRRVFFPLNYALNLAYVDRKKALFKDIIVKVVHIVCISTLARSETCL